MPERARFTSAVRHPRQTAADPSARALYVCARALVNATNNAAERSLRPLVIARKVSGGTRSATGSTTRMILYSICATARIQGKDPTAICQQLLLAPPGVPWPLAVPMPTVSSSPGHSHAS
ncbi:MAG: IS66 family transposase [Chloroflexota bacterium]